LPPITHTYQTWNNCGPATLSMALQYLGWRGTQADTASVLKPDPEDKNVSPYEMEAYVHSLGLDAELRIGGDLTRLKRLIAAGFPVIVETWFIPEPGDQMGHYRLLTGYDDRAGHFVAQDSYNGPNLSLDYAAFDELWRVFNRVYLVLFDPSQAGQLEAILGEDADDRLMFSGALDVAVSETVKPNDECVAYENCADMTAFAWFNVGSNLTSLGRHEEAAAAYDQARVLGLPWRMLWYQFGPYESYYSIGRFDDVITLATATQAPVGNLEESYYWRGLAYLAKDDVQRARSDFQAAVKYNPGFDAAVQALAALD
jgi:tetratricopeptide (TPR) repeat protein